MREGGGAEREREREARGREDIYLACAVMLSFSVGVQEVQADIHISQIQLWNSHFASNQCELQLMCESMWLTSEG